MIPRLMREWIIDLHRLRIAVARAGDGAVDHDLVGYVLALEDRRFWVHHGVDVRGVARVLVRRAQGRRAGGASTIEMQFVRMVTKRAERTLRRKVREMLLALILSHNVPKRTIVASYLCRAYVGHNLRGMESGAQALFGSPVSGCTSMQKRLLAALLQLLRPKIESTAWWIRLNRRSSLISAHTRGEPLLPREEVIVA